MDGKKETPRPAHSATSSIAIVERFNISLWLRIGIVVAFITALILPWQYPELLSTVIGSDKSGNGAMALSEGAKIPSRSLKEDDVMKASVNLATIPGKIVIVGVPGAFTPTCSNQVPSYYDNASTFQEKGVQGIYVLSVNDAFITKAWKKTFSKDTEGASGPQTLLHFVADDTGEWTKEAGLELDMTAVVGGKRSQRYAAIVEDGIVRKIFMEEDPGMITVSHANEVLKHL